MAPANNISRAVESSLVMKRRITVAAALLLFGIAPYASAQVQAQPDNTKENQRPKTQVTADQQPNNRSDLDLTKQIRKALVADKSLSSYAHNVKVVTKAGKVTLSGPVRSDEEKQIVESKATEVAGAGNVTNNLMTKASGTSTTKNQNKKAGA